MFLVGGSYHDRDNPHKWGVSHGQLIVFITIVCNQKEGRQQSSSRRGLRTSMDDLMMMMMTIFYGGTGTKCTGTPKLVTRKRENRWIDTKLTSCNSTIRQWWMTRGVYDNKNNKNTINTMEPTVLEERMDADDDSTTAVDNNNKNTNDDDRRWQPHEDDAEGNHPKDEGPRATAPAPAAAAALTAAPMESRTDGTNRRNHPQMEEDSADGVNRNSRQINDGRMMMTWMTATTVCDWYTRQKI
jgi:hypothetical protein